jgi:hypothetical protein
MKRSRLVLVLGFLTVLTLASHAQARPAQQSTDLIAQIEVVDKTPKKSVGNSGFRVPVPTAGNLYRAKAASGKRTAKLELRANKTKSKSATTLDAALEIASASGGSIEIRGFLPRAPSKRKLLGSMRLPSGLVEVYVTLQRP